MNVVCFTAWTPASGVITDDTGTADDGGRKAAVVLEFMEFVALACFRYRISNRRRRAAVRDPTAIEVEIYCTFVVRVY